MKLGMVIEADRGWDGALLGLLAHGPPVGFGSGDGDQKAQNNAQNAGPQSKTMILLEIGCQPQKKAGRQQNRKTKLGHPHQQG